MTCCRGDNPLGMMREITHGFLSECEVGLVHNLKQEDGEKTTSCLHEDSGLMSEFSPASEEAGRVSSLLTDEFFGFLETCGIPYAILGDTRGYPHHINSDIDIVLGCADIHMFVIPLLQYCSMRGLRCLQVIQHEASCWYIVLSAMSDAERSQFLHPDVCHDYVRQGRVFLKASELLSGRIRTPSCSTGARAFYIPKPASAFIYYLLKKIDKQQITATQGEYLSSQWRKDAVGAMAQLHRFWTGDEVRLLAEAAERNHWPPVISILPVLQRTLRRRLPVTLTALVKDLIRVWKRIRNPTGLHLAFLGPDGVGKTTVIGRVERDLGPAFRRTKRHHLRPFFGHREGDGAPVSNPHAPPLRNRFSSVAKLVWWWLDYTVGYLVEVVPRLTGSTMVLFDRYYYDLLIDQTRYRYGGPYGFARFVGRWIPRPNLVIILDAPAEVVHMRKQEVPLSEVVRQRAAYRALAEDMEDAHVIDASQPLEQVVHKVEMLILTYLERRMNGRYGCTTPH